MNLHNLIVLPGTRQSLIHERYFASTKGICVDNELLIKRANLIASVLLTLNNKIISSISLKAPYFAERVFIYLHLK